MDELTLAGTLGLDWRVDSALFLGRGKVRKLLEILPCREENDSMRNPGLGENLEDLHELEYHRSAPHSQLWNTVMGENLEDLRLSSADPEELECQRSTPPEPLLPSAPRLARQ